MAAIALGNFGARCTTTSGTTMARTALQFARNTFGRRNRYSNHAVAAQTYTHAARWQSDELERRGRIGQFGDHGSRSPSRRILRQRTTIRQRIHSFRTTAQFTDDDAEIT